MSSERASGVVLRTRLLTETSLIVHWLTREQGRLATVAQGARRPKSPFRGKLDLFYETEFSFQRSRRSDLHTLREVVLTTSHPGLRTRLESLRQAAYAAALLELATETETALPNLHRLLRELLVCLEPGAAPPQLVFAFELKVLAESGLRPDLSQTSLDAATRAVARALAERPLANALDVIPNLAQALKLDGFLRSFIARYLERLPRGRAEAVGLRGSAPPAGSAPTGE